MGSESAPIRFVPLTREGLSQESIERKTGEGYEVEAVLTVLRRNIVMRSGPTPPWTRVIAEAGEVVEYERML